MIELFEAIESGYETEMEHGMWYGEAPQDSVRPYAVVTSPGVIPEDTFTADINDVSIQINIYETDAISCFEKLDQAKVFFDGATLAVDDHYLVILHRELFVLPMREDKNKWMAVVGYNCLLQKT